MVQKDKDAVRGICRFLRSLKKQDGVFDARLVSVDLEKQEVIYTVSEAQPIRRLKVKLYFEKQEAVYTIDADQPIRRLKITL